MNRARLSRIFLIAVFACGLLACVHVQLNSSVSGARITVALLRQPTEILSEHLTNASSEVISDIGQGAWDGLSGFQRLLLLGHTILFFSEFDADALYLITASSGSDEDFNLDNEKDLFGTPVMGSWHAILTGEQIRDNQARVSTLTEALYRYLEPQLDGLTDAEIRAELDNRSAELVPDLNDDSTLSYLDVLSWTQLFNALEYRREIAYIDDLSLAVINGENDAVLRELAARVVDGVEGGFQLSGSVSVVEFNKVDGDVNDRNAVYINNDSILAPQRLDTPVILGGYLNEPNSGGVGRSRLVGDAGDFFRVELLAGQVVTLAVAEDPFANDLDLFLYDKELQLVDAAMGVAALESLQIAVAGEYIVNVALQTGASNYRLSIGQSNQLPVQTASRLSDDFNIDQLIVSYRQRQTKGESLARRAARRGMTYAGGGRGRANLLRFQSPREATLSKLEIKADSRLRGAGEMQRRKFETLLALKRMSREADVEQVSLNYRVHATAVPNDTYYPEQRWHYEMLNLPAAWEGSTGEDVTVAVLDTGILLAHPDLQGQLLPGYDFVSDLTSALDGNSIDDNPDDPGDGGGLVDSSFHGTHVAGTIAASTNNGKGVAGVAWNAKIMPLRVLGEEGAGDTYDIMQAVRYAAGLANDSGTLPARAADIINLSLGGGGFSQVEQALFNEVAARGIITIAAAGNEGRRRSFYPASYDNVVSVAAVNINREQAPYSNSHSSVDVAAPGGDSSTNDINGDGSPDLILSTNGDDSSGSVVMNYVHFEGTSMAAPHVAGVAALMKSVYPGLTPGQFDALLQDGGITADLGMQGRDEIYGWGLLNALKAVGAAQELSGGASIAEQPLLAFSPRSLNFGSTASQLPLQVYNAGGGDLQIHAVQAQVDWLTVGVVEGEVISGGYIAVVDRSLLDIGLHRGTIAVNSNAGSAELIVLVTVSDATTDVSGNAGYHYVLLVDPVTDEMVKQDSVVARNGRYEFQFNNVPAGQYILVAGSDSDSDFFICDAGEACGAWPVLSGTKFTTFDVSGDIDGLDFVTGFESGILSSSALGSPTKRQIPRLLRRPTTP
ncbi:MAG: serine protease [Halieaceae bacterium]|jgi:serine protease